MREDEAGWGFVTPHTYWVCPTCGAPSKVAQWEEAAIECDVCGDHDGRVCPRCFWAYDVVYEDVKIEAATMAWEEDQREEGV